MLKRLLLVEDDPAIAEALRVSLGLNGFELTHAETLAEGRRLLHPIRHDALLIDVGLPDGSGIDLCREVRAARPSQIIIMLTAHADEDTAVAGLIAGADDHVRKPFGARELMARLERAAAAQARRSKELDAGPLRLRPDEHAAWFERTPLKLTKREYLILEALARRIDGVVSRDELLDCIGDDGERSDRTIDSHVSHLRKRLTEQGVHGIGIVAEYGLGYRLRRS